MNERPRIWVDDTHPIFRRGLIATLSSNARIVGESSRLRPLPPVDRIDALVFSLTKSSFQKAIPLRDRVTLIALSLSKDDPLLARALMAGVSCILPRDGLDECRLRSSVEAALSGQTSVPASHVASILRSVSETPSEGDSGGLLARELEVLKALAAGYDTKTIADEMSYSERTVKNVVHDLLIKMNSRNRAHAVATAARQGII